MAAAHPTGAPASPDTPTPRWVSLLTDWGRPIVAAWVMIMCAPGEHHLGRLAGWSDTLAWGMAGVLAAYAGIAAAVASKRPSGAPGKRSAVLGAWLSLAVAMSAQPVSHLFVTGHWNADPRPPVWLIVSVSCVPPLVLGHLLHLAATPVPAAPQADAPVTATDTPVTDQPRPAEHPPAEPSPPAAPPEPEPVVYGDPRCEFIRPLYDSGHRPGTKAMRLAVTAAGFPEPSDGIIRGTLRAEIERQEPALAKLPPAPLAIGTATG